VKFPAFQIEWITLRIYRGATEQKKLSTFTLSCFLCLELARHGESNANAFKVYIEKRTPNSHMRVWWFCLVLRLQYWRKHLDFLKLCWLTLLCVASNLPRCQESLREHRPHVKCFTTKFFWFLSSAKYKIRWHIERTTSPHAKEVPARPVFALSPPAMCDRNSLNYWQKTFSGKQNMLETHCVTVWLVVTDTLAPDTVKTKVSSASQLLTVFRLCLCVPFVNSAPRSYSFHTRFSHHPRQSWLDLLFYQGNFMVCLFGKLWSDTWLHSSCRCLHICTQSILLWKTTHRREVIRSV